MRLIRPPVDDHPRPQRSPSVAASDRGRTFFAPTFPALLRFRSWSARQPCPRWLARKSDTVTMDRTFVNL